MKLNIFFVTYDGDKRIEERWEDISKERKEEIANDLSHRFMKTAGFSPVKAPG